MSSVTKGHKGATKGASTPWKWDHVTCRVLSRVLRSRGAVATWWTSVASFHAV